MINLINMIEDKEIYKDWSKLTYYIDKLTFEDYKYLDYKYDDFYKYTQRLQIKSWCNKCGIMPLKSKTLIQ